LPEPFAIIIMDLDQQLQELIDHAPPDGTTPGIVQTIAPALKLIAAQLKHLEYYVLQTLDQGWVMTTLSNRNQPDVEKNVIYAFPTLKDAASGPNSPKNPEVIVIPVPVTHILFQMMAMKSADSIVFFDTPGNLASGIEVKRADLQNVIQLQLQKSQVAPQVPPDIA
jgi:hypothetical protein